MQVESWNSAAQKVDFNLEIDFNEFKRIVPLDTIVLDYGCGYGRTCEVLNSIGYRHTIGCDSSSEMIARGSSKYPHLTLSQNNNVKVEYPDGHFGAIILCAVLTCNPEFQAKVNIISEISRLLIPGGILHVVEFCSQTEKTFESNFGVIMNHQPPQDIKGLVHEFKELKYEIVQVKTVSGQDAKAVNYFGQKDT